MANIPADVVVLGLILLRAMLLTYSVYVWFIVIGGLIRNKTIRNAIILRAAATLVGFFVAMGWLL